MSVPEALLVMGDTMPVSPGPLYGPSCRGEKGLSHPWPYKPLPPGDGKGIPKLARFASDGMGESPVEDPESESSRAYGGSQRSAYRHAHLNMCEKGL